jgi:hypothetical protein
MSLRILPWSRRRGSILLVTVILGTGLALSLGSFIVLSVESTRLSNRSFYANSSLNLAEAGLEEALWALNHGNWSGWSAHESGSGNKVRTISNFDLGQGTSGDVQIVVYGATTSITPRIIAQGRAQPSFGPAVTKQLEVLTHRRSHWATGLVAKDAVTFSGGVANVDSYVSDDPSFSTGGLYDASKRRDKGTAASVSVTTDAVSISNSHIWGYVATGGSEPQAGPNGTILGADSPAGAKIDPDRIATDFTANFDPVSAPTTTGTLLGAVSGDATIGAAGATGTYTATSVANTNGRTIEILGNVTLVVSQYVDIKGTLVVRPDSSLTVYVRGDFEAGGNGAVNQTGLPKNLVIYGTAATSGGQTIKLHGNGVLHAAVYAPNANVELKGGGSSGEACGSIVANDVRITGNYAFHYDEALAKEGSGNPFAIGRWRELTTAADRVNLGSAVVEETLSSGSTSESESGGSSDVGSSTTL